MSFLGHTFPADTGAAFGARASRTGRDARAYPTDDTNGEPVSDSMVAAGAGHDVFDAAQIDAIVRKGGNEHTWPAPIRTRFDNEFGTRQATEQRFLFVIGALVALATILIDWVIAPQLVREGAILRVATVVPITTLGLVAGARGWHKTMAFCVGAAPIAFSAVIVHLALQLPPEDTARYLTSTALVVGLANIILPFSMRWLLLFDAAFIVAAFGTLMVTANYDFIGYVDYLLLLAVVAGATLPMAYRTTRLRQHNFLLSLRAEAISRELTQANRALRELSERDPLTGMANRRYFEQAFAKRIANLGEGGGAELLLTRGRVAVMMIDLDHFKAFNDTNGHQAGDQCLIQVSRALERIFSDVDGVVARYGGEEFVAAVREIEAGDASEIAEKVRAAIGSLQLTGLMGTASSITTSVGVALSSATAALPREELIEMADAALYSAKRAGRNRVEVVEVEKPLRLSA